MTVLYDSPIFGPVHSRRLGVSLGVNLMPSDGKVCTFDCLYCECGLNSDFPARGKRPTLEQVSDSLEWKLEQMKQEGVLPDVITFAGNGEPTAHPDFLRIIERTVELRNQHCPSARISVLSNSTMITRKDVFKALEMVDNNILKLDTVQLDYIQLLDRPTGRYDLEAILRAMKDFKGHCVIQSMFLKGRDNQGKDVSNVSDDYVGPWLETVKEINPQSVMVYTIDRETPVKSLEKASREELDGIAERVRMMGIPCSVAY